MASGLKRPGMSGYQGAYPDGGYAARLNASVDIYNAEPTIPATNYADAPSSLRDTMGIPKSKISNRDSAIVSRMPRLLGLVFNWSWGGNDQYQNSASLPQPRGGLTGLVASSAFQRVLVQLHDWQTNRRWYIAYPMTGGVFNLGNPIRGTYPTFRTQQINANTSGGVGKGRMQPRPRFTAVQRVPKYNASPRYYNTRSGFGNAQGSSGYSTLNGPGV